jgi:transposase-like protein
VVANRPVYLAIGIDCEGAKQVLGLWVGPTTGESAKFWLSVLAELKGRGVADVCIVCCDGLTGLPDAISVTWPQAIVQLCVVHLIRASLRYASRKYWVPLTRICSRSTRLRMRPRRPPRWRPSTAGGANGIRRSSSCGGRTGVSSLLSWRSRPRSGG